MSRLPGDTETRHGTRGLQARRPIRSIRGAGLPLAGAWMSIVLLLASCAAERTTGAPGSARCSRDAGAEHEERIFLEHADAVEIARVLDELRLRSRQGELGRFQCGGDGCALPRSGAENELFHPAQDARAPSREVRADPRANVLLLRGFGDEELVRLRELVARLDLDAAGPR